MFWVVMFSYGRVFSTNTALEGLAAATVMSIPSKLHDVPAVAFNTVPSI
jgi:hypothetical protein